MDQQNIPWNEISAHLKGQADNEQLEKIKDWLEQSKDNPKVLKEIVSSWQMTQKQTAFYEPDLKGLWQELFTKIGLQSKKRNLFIRYNKWIAAAVIIFAVFAGGTWIGYSFWRTSQQMIYASVVSPVGSRTKIILPDSTAVWLNSGAELRYPSIFKKKTREVYVSGECFFEVKKNPQKTFIVHGNSLDVKVLGTSFNFKENLKNNRTEVVLVEGHVKILDKSDRPLISMVPGEHFSFNGTNGVMRKVNSTDPYTAWKENMIVFENEPLGDVLKTLESWYGVTIKADASVLKNHNYTFKVKTESLREVLDLISVITPITYSIEGDMVTLKYK